jgi:hypothetical protein
MPMKDRNPRTTTPSSASCCCCTTAVQRLVGVQTLRTGCTSHTGTSTSTWYVVARFRAFFQTNYDWLIHSTQQMIPDSFHPALLANNTILLPIHSNVDASRFVQASRTTSSLSSLNADWNFLWPDQEAFRFHCARNTSSKQAVGALFYSLD